MLSRRDFLKTMTASVVALTAGHVAAQQTSWPLWMRRGKEEYRFDAATQEGFAAARYLLRDIRGGGVQGYPHLNLLQSLSTAQSWFAMYGVHSLFDATSGLRLPHTNAGTEGAARASFHLPTKEGWFFAADFVPKKVDLVQASGWLRAAGIGGIGLYVERGFIHADVGPNRAWMRR